MGYLGYRPDDATAPYARFFQPKMAPLPGHVVEALEHGPQAEPVLPVFEEAAALLANGYQLTENGYGRLGDGGVQVSVRTDMPGVTPEMWAWWFGWHGCEDARYKLWHPRAHVCARWSDGRADLGYLGRTSLVQEYLGSEFTRVAIQFVQPTRVGLDEGRLNGAVAVCARLGSCDVPVDVGWLIHHVRPTPEGSEMRSRFWMGGQHVALRRGRTLVDKVIRPIAARELPDPRDLLVHCAQEMNHLAAFLPQLHERFSDV